MKGKFHKDQGSRYPGVFDNDFHCSFLDQFEKAVALFKLPESLIRFMPQLCLGPAPAEAGGAPEFTGKIGAVDALVRSA
jgi:hypothetical protein